MQFTREGTEALYTWTHEALDLLFNHARTVPEALLDTPVRGFGHDTCCCRGPRAHGRVDHHVEGSGPRA